MSYVYLFELKSIQSYITRTGKLRDLTNLSDNLDNLMDDSNDPSDDDSILGMVLKSIDPHGEIEFIRRKGGSIYSFCPKMNILQEFRSVWTMVVQQMFPYIQFTDYLGEIDESKIGSSMDDAFSSLNASVNTPVLTLPISSAVIQANSRTGLADVNVPPEIVELKKQADDSDLISVRNSKTLGTIRKNLYHKFFNDSSLDKNNLSQKFKTFFEKYQKKLDKDNSGNTDRDIAYIHFDGNSIGQTAISIRKEIKELPLNQQKDTLREFSRIITSSTQNAVADALKTIYKEINGNSEQPEKEDKLFVFRPLVLGGDDVTLLIEPKYALKFVKYFCKNFEAETREGFRKAENLNRNLKKTKIKELTASGGILFNKINHPASNTHAMVESLAEKAKKLTKSTEKRRAAVAFYRLSSTTSESFDEVIKKGRSFTVGESEITVGNCSYYVDSMKDGKDSDPTVDDFLDLIETSVKNRKSSSSIMQKFRVMLSALANGDITEAKRIYDFMMKKSHVSPELKESIMKFFHFVNNGKNNGEWYTECGNSFKTSIADLLVLHHYINEPDLFDGREEDN